MISVCIESKIPDFQVGCGYECWSDGNEMIVCDSEECEWPCEIIDDKNFILYSEDAKFEVIS